MFIKHFKTAFTLYFSFLALSLAAQTYPEVKVNAPIESVKIYIQGAEVVHKQSVSLTEGRQTVVFTGLSPKLYEQTVQFAAGAGIKILSISTQTNFLAAKEPPTKIKSLEDSVILVKQRMAELVDELNAYNQEREMLRTNYNTKGDDKDLSLDNLKNSADFFRERMLNINKQITRLNRLVEAQNKQLFDIKLQLYEWNAAQISLAEVLVVLDADKAKTVQVELKYIVGDAGWASIYDLYAGEVDKPINLIYRAQAYNNTGVNWNEVKLVLSTADPLESATQPTLAVWNLNNTDYSLNNNVYGANNLLVPQQKQMMLNDNSALRFNDSKRGMSMNTNPNTDEMNYSNNLSYVQQIMGEDFKNENDYNTDKFQEWANKKKPEPTVGLTTIELPEVNAEFDIAQKYTIPCDRKPYSIEIASHNLPAQYNYLCIPKINTNVYLIARILDWEELNLISGSVNIYNNNKYIAKSFLNINNLTDTLYVSLGKDQNVVVKRTKIKNSSKKSFLGNQKKASLAYEIAVKNNKSIAIDLEIQDQIPISDDKEVIITLEEKSNADFEPTKGFLSWRMPIAASESKTFIFSYSVKYPKERIIRVEMGRQRQMAAPKF
jgi:Domain of unknown function (DUF4139)/N-terminal domain of unknown function (DUF4140)